MKNKAFTLIELLIVVIIIGVVYTLAVTNFQKVGNKAQHITLQNLKPYLQTFPHKESVKFLCLDDCSSCFILVDGKKVDGLEGLFDDFLDENIEVYRYDFSSGFQELEKDIYFNKEEIEENVCFSYDINREGIGKQIVVKFREKVYDYTAISPLSPIYNTLDDVIQHKDNQRQEVLR